MHGSLLNHFSPPVSVRLILIAPLFIAFEMENKLLAI